MGAGCWWETRWVITDAHAACCLTCNPSLLADCPHSICLFSSSITTRYMSLQGMSHTNNAPCSVASADKAITLECLQSYDGICTCKAWLISKQHSLVVLNYKAHTFCSEIGNSQGISSGFVSPMMLGVCRPWKDCASHWNHGLLQR